MEPRDFILLGFMFGIGFQLSTFAFNLVIAVLRDIVRSRMENRGEYERED